MESNKEFCYYFIKNLKQFILIIILLLTTIIFNMNGVRAEEECNSDDPLCLKGDGVGEFTGCDGKNCIQRMGFFIYQICKPGNEVSVSDPTVVTNSWTYNGKKYAIGGMNFNELKNFLNEDSPIFFSIYARILNDNNGTNLNGTDLLNNLIDNNCVLKVVPRMAAYQSGQNFVKNPISDDEREKIFTSLREDYYTAPGIFEEVNDNCKDGNPCIKRVKVGSLQDALTYVTDNFVYYWAPKSVVQALNYVIIKGEEIEGQPLGVCGYTSNTTDKEVYFRDTLKYTYTYNESEYNFINGINYNSSILKPHIEDGKAFCFSDDDDDKPGYNDYYYGLIIPSNYSHKLTIKKVKNDTFGLLQDNNNQNLITSDSTEFKIYQGSNCTGTLYKTVTTSGGRVIVDLPVGTYSVKETRSPGGYNENNELNNSTSCVITSVYVDRDITKTVGNVPGCKAKLDEIISNGKDIASLISLYQKYPGYNGLLNFDSPSCDVVNCAYSNNRACLSGSYGDSAPLFNSRNLSCFNETFEFDGTTVFCLNTFNLENKVGGSSFGKVTAGQIALQKIKYSDAIAATGTVTKKCFALNKSYLNIDDKYSDYVESVSLDNKKLQTKDENGQEQKDNNLTGGFISSSNLFEYSASVNYYLNPVYAKIGTGKPTESNSNNATKLGYGVLLPFDVNDYKERTYYIPFSIKFKYDFFNNLYDSLTYATNQCEVQTKPEVVKKELQLEFRIIDTNNPFPGVSGDNDRLVGSNWRSVSLDINGNGNLSDDLGALQDKIRTGFTSVEDFKYDINKDGKLDDKDLDYYNWLKDNASNNLASPNSYSSNPYITYIMENTNNSYDKDGKGPKYTITLTPDNIKKIREYNVTHKYDDFTLNCTNGDNCKMDEFSSYLNQIGVTIKTN